MPTVTISFDLETENDQLEDALNAQKYKFIIEKMFMEFKKTHKYNMGISNPDKEATNKEKIISSIYQDKLIEFLEEENLS